MVILYERFENEPSKLPDDIESDVEIQPPNEYISLGNNDNPTNLDENFEEVKIDDDTEVTRSNYRVTIQDPGSILSNNAFNKKYIDYMLEHKYPSKLYVASIVFGGLIGISLISLQIAAIFVRAPFYFVAAGIWTGFITILIQISIYALVNEADHKSVIAIYRMYIFCVIMNILLNVLLNMYAISDSCIGLRLLHGLKCTKRDYAGFNVTMIVLGVANSIFGIIFIHSLTGKLSKIREILKNNPVYSTNLAFSNSVLNIQESD